MVDALPLGHDYGNVLIFRAREVREGREADRRLTGLGNLQVEASMSAPATISPIPAIIADAPGMLTRLAGRTREVRELLALLRQPETRLVTISGPGGVGKTRLARELATLAEREFAGVAVVALDPIRDPALVGPTIAQALGGREIAGQTWFDFVAGVFSDRHWLLMLDNFEQIVDAAPIVHDLLTACPRLTILVTSRECLRLTGERDFPLDPLQVPPGAVSTVAEAMAADAVELFVQRAQAANPAFQLTAENAPVVVEICRQLDGLPLAIELAASRIKVLSPRALLARLSQRLMLLTGGARDLPLRLQTMRDAIAWSYDLLPPDEQQLFRRLSVFAGSFTLEAAEAIQEVESDEGTGHKEQGTAGSAFRLPPPVLDSIASLVEKSLLRSVEGVGGEARFAMLETVREFAASMLARDGEGDETRLRHAEYLRDFAERAEPELVGPNQDEWLDRIEAERDNLRAALGWAIDGQQPDQRELAQRLCGALWRFWATRGYLTEGKSWIERAVALGESDPAVTAKVYHHLGNLALDLGDYTLARIGYDAGLLRWQSVDNRRGLASSYNGLGLLAFYLADYTEARRLHEASLALRREIDDRQGLGNSLTNLGNVANAERDYTGARALHEQALAVRRAMGDTGGVAYSLFNLADVARQLGDLAASRHLLDQSLALFQEVGDKLGVGYALANLGRVASLQGEFASAAAIFVDAIAIRQELGDKRGLVECLEGIAPVAHQLGQLDLAGRLFGAVEAQREALAAPLPLTEEAAQAAAIAALRKRAGESALRNAWAIGRAMTLTEAVEAARTVSASTSGAAQNVTAPVPVPTRAPIAPAPSSAEAPHDDFGLSEREREVLRYLAAGLTDREIAQQLAISPRTVNVHVANLRGKLGVSSRAAAVALAHRHHLI